MKQVRYFPTSDDNYKPFFTYDYPHENWKFGDWILIQHVKPAKESDTKYQISEPIFALFVGFTVWDQALVINYIRPLNDAQVFDHDPEVEHIPLWHENCIVLDHWHEKPTISELRMGLRNKRV